jgi:uncharacterized protein YbjT (DUF2867 family)
MHVVVVGGTGLIGSRVVNRLRDRGADVRVGSLRTGINTYTGQGLAELFAGADVVVDATNVNRPAYDYEQAHDFFETSTLNVLGAELDADVQHHVGISMIGAHAIDSEFFRGKASQEQLVRSTPTPHTLLRTTMLHEVVPRLVDHAATTHFVRLPPVRVQPVAADAVAGELVHRALDEPLNEVFELAGPEVRFLDELARQVLTADGDTRPVLADHSAYYLGARLPAGTEVLLPTWRTAPSPFQDWLSTGRQVHAQTHPGTVSPTHH